MDTKNIINFRESIKNFSVEELKNKKSELENKITKMILDSDVTMQIAIVEALLKEKEK